MGDQRWVLYLVIALQFAIPAVMQTWARLSGGYSALGWMMHSY